MSRGGLVIDPKRKRVRSPEINSTNKKTVNVLTNYWLSSTVKLTNRFEKLGEVVENDQSTCEAAESDGQQKEDPVRTQKSPPIFISHVQNIKPLQDALNEVAADKYLIKSLANNQVKVQPKSSLDYLPIITMLKQKDTRFHTYQLKQEKPYRVVLKNVHPSTNTDDIKKELQELGHKVTRISNIQQHITRRALPMFFEELKVAENNKEIFNVKRLLHMVVAFEPPRIHREIPQCMRCQQYGHTKNYCFNNPVCVKCAENHLTSACNITSKTNHVKCANCGGDHPASYKGCPKRKELQKKLFPALREKRIEINRTTSSQKQDQNGNFSSEFSSPRNQRRTNVSYANATANVNGSNSAHNLQADDNTGSVNQQENIVNNNKLEVMMAQLLCRMDTMMNFLTCLINKIGNGK
ncbi:hypothetical protein TKK_0008130 [Trichogramma kaykai]